MTRWTILHNPPGMPHVINVAEVPADTMIDALAIINIPMHLIWACAARNRIGTATSALLSSMGLGVLAVEAQKPEFPPIEVPV